MGRFTKRPYEGQRPSSVRRKVSKEIDMGRIVRKSPAQQRLRDRVLRLDSLQAAVQRQHDPIKRQPLYEQFANMAASSPIEVFDPTEISGITRYSDLSDPGILSSASNYDFHGQRPDFLPLHHLVKILGKRVYLNESGDKYAYLLGSSSHQTDQMTDIAARNLRGLEYMLLGFSSRILPGQSLDLQIEGRRVQVPYHEGSYYTEGDPVVQGLRRILEKSGVHALPHYHLKRIKDGNQKVGTSLHVVAEPRVYRDENRATKSVIISYLTHVNAVG